VHHRIIESQGAALWLYRRLHALGIDLGGAAGAALRRSAHESIASGLRVDGETMAVTAILRDAGIAVAPIKGPARRIATDFYPYADARSTLDVDLIVPRSVAFAAHEILVQHGYAPVRAPEDAIADHFHLPALIGQRAVAVELHVSTAPWLSPDEAWSRQSAGADVIARDGAEFNIAGPTELLWDAMSHAFIDGPAGFRLRGFLDGAVIIAAQRAIDWDVIAGRMAAGEIRDPENGHPVAPGQMRRWIATAGKLAGLPLPPEFEFDGQYPLESMLHWRSLVVQRVSGRPIRHRLIEESIRCEAGMPLTPCPKDCSIWARIRRRTATTLARGAYCCWRSQYQAGRH